MADEDEAKEYRWETGYERTWLVILFNHFFYYYFQSNAILIIFNFKGIDQRR